jgi:uncharacterized protein YdeI (YjbR/CyaY-like superfamily)
VTLKVGKAKRAAGARPPRPRGFAGPTEFRAWLKANGKTAAELHLRCVKTGLGRDGLTYRQALDEALCLGWIDGVRRAHDASSFSVRFTPRRTRSEWSAVNIRRFRELQAQGRVAAAGLAAFDARVESQYSYESRQRALSPELQKAFRARPTAWRFFAATPAWYQRTCAFYVMSARRPETRARRFGVLIARCERGQAVPPLKLPATRRKKKEAK